MNDKRLICFHNERRLFIAVEDDKWFTTDNIFAASDATLEAWKEFLTGKGIENVTLLEKKEITP